MSFGGGSTKFVEDMTAQNQMAGVSREMYADYVSRFRPHETKLLSTVMDPETLTKDVTMAGEEAASSFDATGEIMRRDAGRYGLSLSGDREADLIGRMRRAKILGIIDSRSKTRTASDDRKTAVMQGLTATGRGLSNTATQTMNQGATLEVNRNSANRQIAASNSANTWSGIGTMAGIGLTLAGFCWVAREVYGEDDYRWRVFRHWLMAKSPLWLFCLYLACGERFAAYIHDKPRIKRILRSWMDRVVSAEETEYASAIG